MSIRFSLTFSCHRRTGTCDVSLETWSIVACVFKPSQNFQFGRVFDKDGRGVESEPSSASATPMDVDAVGKGNGKGCFVCGRPGHAQKDCKLNQAKGKAQGKGKAKDAQAISRRNLEHRRSVNLQRTTLRVLVLLHKLPLNGNAICLPRKIRSCFAFSFHQLQRPTMRRTHVRWSTLHQHHQ